MGEVFLPLTDYISSGDLSRLSASSLFGLVCGPQGTRLLTIQQKTGADLIEFVSQPVPGFRILASTLEVSAKAAASIKSIFKSIHRQSTRRAYHPLFSSQPVKASLKPGLLPCPSVAPLSPELCMQFIHSPYLVRVTTPEHEGGSDRSDACSPFDSEVADLLPGFPGVRQTREYKKLRRKISDIDRMANVNLDFCQQRKVERRPEFIRQIRMYLQFGVIHERSDCVTGLTHTNATVVCSCVNESTQSSPTLGSTNTETLGWSVSAASDCTYTETHGSSVSAASECTYTETHGSVVSTTSGSTYTEALPSSGTYMETLPSECAEAETKVDFVDRAVDIVAQQAEQAHILLEVQETKQRFVHKEQGNKQVVKRERPVVKPKVASSKVYMSDSTTQTIYTFKSLDDLLIAIMAFISGAVACFAEFMIGRSSNDTFRL